MWHSLPHAGSWGNTQNIQKMQDSSFWSRSCRRYDGNESRIAAGVHVRYSSSVIVGGFRFLLKCNLIVWRSKSFRLFCCLFLPQLIFLALRSHMLPSSSCTSTYKLVRWVLYIDRRNTRGKSDWVTYTHGMYIYTPECMDWTHRLSSLSCFQANYSHCTGCVVKGVRAHIMQG